MPTTLNNLTVAIGFQLAPLQQYSCQDGHLTDWHIAHMGGIAQRGPGFLMFEGTAILPEGRISPQDADLWQNSQIEPMRRVVDLSTAKGRRSDTALPRGS
ncbi:2-4-dienoyl-CoA reductase [Penicillium lividum]|nr:2-4-dienoyl-CoA reductase [Penicillium lividum]